MVDLDPVYCMPVSVVEKKGLKKGWKALERRQARPEDSDARFFRPIWFVIMVIGLMAILLGTFPAF